MCGLVTLGKKAGKNFYVTYLMKAIRLLESLYYCYFNLV